MSAPKVRRTLVNPPGDWRAVCQDTGEVLECRDFVVLLQRVAEALAFAPQHGWRVEANG